MAGSVNPVKPGGVSCEECLRQVQPARVEMEEVNDYVMYFFGLECYIRWRHEPPPEGGG
ncbi:MAG: hypothetical protein PVI50_00400 [Gammaproteobacteria bacterium]|jgi:hypothetical protein